MNRSILYLTLFAAATGMRAEVSFQGLGDLAGGMFYSTPTDLSSDGTVVVGQAVSGDGWVAFRWTAGGGMQSLGDLPGGAVSSVAFGVSPDGTAATGWSESGTNQREAFVWTGSGMVGLGDLAGGSYFSSGRGITNGGTAVIGAASNSMGWEPFRWTQGGSMQGLGDLNDDNNTSVMAVSGDCTYYAGTGGSSPSLAYRGRVGGSKQTLGDLPGGTSSSSAYGISNNGSYVVGGSNSFNGSEAFFWSEATGMQALGDLQGGRFTSSAWGVTDDGRYIVGSGHSSNGYRAVLWDRNGQVHDLNTYLTNRGINLGDWKLESAVNITPDGSAIIGSGTNPEGNTEAWIARIEINEPFERAWGDALFFAEGWRYSNWYNWFHPGLYPLIYHQEHGWQICQGDAPQSLLFYDFGMQVWLWTGEAVYPFHYQYGSNPGWLFYVKGGLPGQRWFYHYSHQAYFNEADL